MSHGDKPVINPLSAVAVALAMLATAIAVLVTAYGFHGGSGLFPRFIGWIFVGLAGGEFLLQLKAFTSARKVPSAHDPDKTAARARFLKEVNGVLWIAALLAGVYLAGFLIAVPVYQFTFMRFAGRRSLIQSAALAIGSTIFIYLLFTGLLNYKLYPGILFGA